MVQTHDRAIRSGSESRPVNKGKIDALDTTPKEERGRDHMRHATKEQQEKAQERRTAFKEIVKKVAELSEEQRLAIAEKISITTCEGHPLSVHNNCLIASQGGEGLTLVGGFKQWLKQGRAVKKGEHGYMILFPREKKNGDNDAQEPTRDEAEKPEIRFLIGYVFDISQTMEIQTA